MLFRVGILICLSFDPEDGGDIYLRTSVGFQRVTKGTTLNNRDFENFKFPVSTLKKIRYKYMVKQN
jgi:hypothetical protein